MKPAIEIQIAAENAEYQLKLDVYERRFKTQQSMCNSLLAELEVANITIRKLKDELKGVK